MPKRKPANGLKEPSREKSPIKKAEHPPSEEFSFEIHGFYAAVLTGTGQNGTVGSGTSSDYNNSAVRQNAEVHFKPKLKI